MIMGRLVVLPVGHKGVTSKCSPELSRVVVFGSRVIYCLTVTRIKMFTFIYTYYKTVNSHQPFWLTSLFNMSYLRERSSVIGRYLLGTFAA